MNFIIYYCMYVYILSISGKWIHTKTHDIEHNFVHRYIQTRTHEIIHEIIHSGKTNLMEWINFERINVTTYRCYSLLWQRSDIVIHSAGHPQCAHRRTLVSPMCLRLQLCEFITGKQNIQIRIIFQLVLQAKRWNTLKNLESLKRQLGIFLVHDLENIWCI